MIIIVIIITMLIIKLGWLRFIRNKIVLTILIYW